MGRSGFGVLRLTFVVPGRQAGRQGKQPGGHTVPVDGEDV
jgi:hypothetical protein